jgi:hypothetical protein
MAASWGIDEIIGINPLQPGQAKSQIDHLIAVAATCEEDLCELAEWQEDYQEDRVLCIFQLPFAFSEMKEPVVLPAQEHGVSIQATFTQQNLCCDLKGNMYVSNGDCGTSDEIWCRQITRCVMSLPVWGKRAQYYDAYQARCLPTGVADEVIIPAHESWIMDRALKTKDYEYNLVRRMLREVLYASRILLKAIRVTTLYHCDHDYHFSGMFWMPTPGRVTYTQPPRPIAGEILKSSDAGGHVVIPNLDNAVRHRLREVTRFERALVSFERIRRQGDPKAALIGVIAVIESVLKEKLSTKANLAKLLHDERLGTFDLNDIAVADTLRKARNAIVHEYLSTEHDTGRSYVSKSDRAALNADLDRLCIDGIQTARSIFRHLNLNF